MIPRSVFRGCMLSVGQRIAGDEITAFAFQRAGGVRRVRGVVADSGVLHVARGPWVDLYAPDLWAYTATHAQALLIVALEREQDVHRHEIAKLEQRLRKLRKTVSP